MRRYKALLIDADETLLDFRAAERYAIGYINDMLHIQDADAPANYSKINAQCWRDYEAGLITQDEVKVRRFREYLQLYGKKQDSADVAEKYADALGSQCILLDGALEVLEKVSLVMPIALVTNGIGRVQRGRLTKGDLWKYFRAVIISQEIGTQKPDPEMLFAALRELGGIDVQHALMCGDSLTSDMLAANRAGMDACWYNPNHKAKPDHIQLKYEIDDIRALIPIALG